MNSSILVSLAALLVCCLSPAAEVYTTIEAGDPSLPDSEIRIGIGVRDNKIGNVGSYAVLVRWSPGAVSYVRTEDGGFGVTGMTHIQGSQAAISGTNALASLREGLLCAIAFRTAVAPLPAFHITVEGYGPLPLSTGPPPVRVIPVSCDSSATVDLGGAPPAAPRPTPICPLEYPGDPDGDGLDTPPEHRIPAGDQTCSLLPDSDGDGLADNAEDANGNGARDPSETDPRHADSDGDGLEDGIEVLLLGTDPLSDSNPAAYTDADGDRLPASLDPDDGSINTDGDYFTDAYEAAVVGLHAVTDDSVYPPLGDLNNDGVPALLPIDPLLIMALFLDNIPIDTQVFGGDGFTRGDLDRDGAITNVDAVHKYNAFLSNALMPATTVVLADADRDGVADSREASPFPGAQKTNMILSDSDVDGLLDGVEDANANGLQDPGETAAYLRDSDGDQIGDGVERAMGTDPLVPNGGAFADSDGDRLPDAYDPDPSDIDSDDDCIRDGYDAAWNGDVGAAADAERSAPLGDVDGDGTAGNVDALAMQSLFIGTITHVHPVFDRGPYRTDGYRFANVGDDVVVSNLDALIVQSLFIGTIDAVPLY